VVQLDVRYRAELISYVHQGEENAETASAPSRDLWTFERPLKQDGPNWQLVATQAEA
jgi:predicted lipid-binding transport protein (Tim44 family)